MALWGGRFRAQTDEGLRRFGDSIAFDQRLYAADIRGSVAYAGALGRAGLITTEEQEQLIHGLGQILDEFASGSFAVAAGDEDIHTAVERRLGELVGSVAGKLHTGRSRNDQVATDLRLYLLEQLVALEKGVWDVQEAILTQAQAHLDLIMPGYTHLQPAQPVLFSHWLMSYFWKLQRDRVRVAVVQEHTSESPLGAGALAGNPFPIDRRALSKELGFRGVTQNSIDAVADRDCLVEFLSCAALLQVHLSSLAEDLILFSNPMFGFVDLDEAYTTGSSLMPQKKNPDSLELVRGKSGRLVGHLTGVLTMLKGLPSGYNKDLQEDKEALFDAVDTLALELPLVAGVVRTLQVHGGNMLAALDDSLLATDLADYLVRRGVPFREAHQAVGRLVQFAESRQLILTWVPLADYQRMHPAFAEDVYEVFDFRRSIEARAVEGGTATAAVQEQMERAKLLLGSR
jgi:argininosuccinate lyase